MYASMSTDTTLETNWTHANTNESLGKFRNTYLEFLSVISRLLQERVCLLSKVCKDGWQL
jgi:hypothetical protein